MFRVTMTEPKHEVAYDELMDLIKKHVGELSALELLAIAANMVGKLIALQDQRSVTAKEATDVVSANIEVGNRQVLEKIENASRTRQ